MQFNHVIIEISVLNANSFESDQMPHSAASDLGLYCLCRSHKRDTSLIWVNQVHFTTMMCLKTDG